MSTNEEMIKQMYASQLASQKEQLSTNYENALSELDTQKQTNQKTTDEKLRRTSVDAQRQQKNSEEYYAASGLSSGARAQARLAQDNQLQANLTALRTAQQEADATVERQRGLLAKEYESAIQKAQADNDLALAQALYEEAQKAEAKLLAQQEAAANIMAQAGDYSRYGELYGLTADEISKLNGSGFGNTEESSEKVVVDTSGAGNNKSEVSNAPDFSGPSNNGSLETACVVLMQQDLGVSADGLWGPKSREAAYNKWGTADPDAAWQKYVESQNNYTDALESYVRMKQDGYSQSELDAVLRDLVAEGLITQAQATDIRDYRY